MSCAFLFLLLSSSNAISQVIPNGSFEEWGDLGPIGWTTQNTPVDYKPATQSDRSVDGNSSLHVQVIDSSGLKDVPFCFVGDYITYGFAIDEKPTMLQGYLSTSFKDDDDMNILVVMMRQGSIVGNGGKIFRDNMEEFTSFSIPIEYIGDVQPDQARIILGMGEPPVTAGSEFYIDALTFSNEPLEVAAPGSSEIFTVAHSGEGATIDFRIKAPERATLNIVDLYGRTIKNLYSGTTASMTIYWDGHGLANGLYFVHLVRPGRTEVRKVFLSR